MKKNALFQIIKSLIVILFIVSIVIIAIYPVPNQPVTIVIETSTGCDYIILSSSEIAALEDLEVVNDGIGEGGFKEIRIYRQFKSLCVEKIVIGNIHNYAEINGNVIKFKVGGIDLLKKISMTVMMERLIVAECLLAVTMLSWILVNAMEEKLDPNNWNNHGPIKEIGRFFHDVMKYRQFMNYAAKADLKAEVANSYLNRLWWLLEPFFNMLVYVIVFGKVMGSSVENYATFVFSGLLLWNFFSKTINYSVKCVRSNRDIVTKVYVPKHVLLMSNMILNFYKLIFSLIVLVPMLIIFKVDIGINVLWIIPACILMLTFSFGIGMFFLHYGVYIDDLGYAVGILLQMLMFLSGVFYDAITGLTAPLNVIMLVLNPVSMFIDAMRNALLYNTVTNVPLMIIWLILSLFISYIGIHLVYKNENGYVKVV